MLGCLGPKAVVERALERRARESHVRVVDPLRSLGPVATCSVVRWPETKVGGLLWIS